MSVEYTEMDYQDLDEIVQTLPGKADFESVAMWEWGNGKSHTVKDVGKESYPGFLESAKRDFDKWMKEPGCKTWGIGIHQLFEGLRELGLVQPGNYIIHVSW